jgi:hypothetical protein
MINFSLYTKSLSGQKTLQTLKERFLEHFEDSFEGMIPTGLDIEGLLDDCRDIYLNSPVNFLVIPSESGLDYNCYLIDHGVGRIHNMEKIILAA